jgi:acyl-CoA synthetase (AMP-forming)/AMP-acid ligase II
MNIADFIFDKSTIQPHKTAIIDPRKKQQITFIEFEKMASKISNYLIHLGVKKGDRVILFVKPGIYFPVMTMSLFKIGALPVLIDPGMGLESLLKCVKKVKPQVMIAEKIVHFIKFFKSDFFKTIQHFFTPHSIVNKSMFEKDTFQNLSMNPSDPGAILFTSGGTGTPKGVVTTHEILINQTQMLKEMFKLTRDDVDMPGFPLFALFTLSMGMTSIIPHLNPAKPASVDPKKIIPDLLKYKVTFAAGSPAIWGKVGLYAKEKNQVFKDLKSVVMFGAPVRGEIHEIWKPLLSDGTTYTPYGATECLPISLISGHEVLNETWSLTKQGKGVCVGKIIQGMDVKIFSFKNNGEILKPYDIGEIVVSGKTVTPEYFADQTATQKAKFILEDKLHHRMGDIGYLDHHQQLWFLGRKVHIVHDLFPIEVEGIINTHPLVKKSALVRCHDLPCIVVELKTKSHDQDDLKKELLSLVKKYNIFEIEFFSPFPVDVRHNIKIDRIKLGKMLEKKKGSR